MTENNFLILSRIIFGNPSTYNPPLMVDLYPNIHINYVTQHLFSPVYTVIKLFTQYNNLNCAPLFIIILFKKLIILQQNIFRTHIINNFLMI